MIRQAGIAINEHMNVAKSGLRCLARIYLQPLFSQGENKVAVNTDSGNYKSRS